jgi:hypothetical protein
VEYVQSGTTTLQDAKTLQKKTRKWMCCAIILLLVTAAVIVIVVSRPADLLRLLVCNAGRQQEGRVGVSHASFYSSCMCLPALRALAYMVFFRQACPRRWSHHSHVKTD